MDSIKAYVDLFVPCDHENGVVGQKRIYAAILEFYIRPMIGEHIDIACTLPEGSDERDKLIYAIVTRIEHIPPAFATGNSAFHIDALLVDIDYVRDLIRITEVLDQSLIWSGHSIS